MKKMTWNSEMISLLIMWRKDLRDDIAVKQQKFLTEGERKKWALEKKMRLNITKWYLLDIKIKGSMGIF